MEAKQEATKRPHDMSMCLRTYGINCTLSVGHAGPHGQADVNALVSALKRSRDELKVAIAVYKDLGYQYDIEEQVLAQAESALALAKETK